MAARCAGRSSASFPVLLAFLLAALALPARAAAQSASAWVPVAGEGSVSVTFQALEYSGHFDEGGQHAQGHGPIPRVRRHLRVRVWADRPARVDRETAVHRLAIHRYARTSRSWCSSTSDMTDTAGPIRRPTRRSIPATTTRHSRISVSRCATTSWTAVSPSRRSSPRRFPVITIEPSARRRPVWIGLRCTPA